MRMVIDFSFGLKKKKENIFMWYEEINIVVLVRTRNRNSRKQWV